MNKEDDSEKIKRKLVFYSEVINSRDIEKIHHIMTNNGFSSLMVISDSMKNKSYISRLCNDFKSFNVFSIQNHDSIIVLSMGKEDKILGATHGFVFLKKENLKIDLIRSGK